MKKFILMFIFLYFNAHSFKFFLKVKKNICGAYKEIILLDKEEHEKRKKEVLKELNSLGCPIESWKIFMMKNKNSFTKDK
jgi:hypothetical protein